MSLHETGEDEEGRPLLALTPASVLPDGRVLLHAEEDPFTPGTLIGHVIATPEDPSGHQPQSPRGMFWVVDYDEAAEVLTIWDWEDGFRTIEHPGLQLPWDELGGCRNRPDYWVIR
jgi:hypothetical protein